MTDSSLEPSEILPRVERFIGSLKEMQKEILELRQRLRETPDAMLRLDQPYDLEAELLAALEIVVHDDIDTASGAWRPLPPRRPNRCAWTGNEPASRSPSCGPRSTRAASARKTAVPSTRTSWRAASPSSRATSLPTTSSSRCSTSSVAGW